MSRVLVLYVDSLDDVHAAAVGQDRAAVGTEAWQQLRELVGPDAALRDYRCRVYLLPPGAGVRFVIGYQDRHGGRQDVAAFTRLDLARNAAGTVNVLSHYRYTVRAEVQHAAVTG